MINLSGYLLQVLMIFHFEPFTHRIGEASNTLEMTVLFLHNVYDKRFSLTKWLAEINVTLSCLTVFLRDLFLGEVFFPLS